MREGQECITINKSPKESRTQHWKCAVIQLMSSYVALRLLPLKSTEHAQLWSNPVATCVGSETVDSSRRFCCAELGQTPGPITHSSIRFVDFVCCWHCSFTNCRSAALSPAKSRLCPFCWSSTTHLVDVCCRLLVFAASHSDCPSLLSRC